MAHKEGVILKQCDLNKRHVVGPGVFSNIHMTIIDVNSKRL